MEVHLVLIFILIAVVSRKLRHGELVVPSVELNVEQLIDDVTYRLAVASNNVLWLEGFGALGSELLEVTDELVESIRLVTFKVFEWYEYS